MAKKLRHTFTSNGIVARSVDTSSNVIMVSISKDVECHVGHESAETSC
jgi:hypothetical protein